MLNFRYRAVRVRQTETGDHLVLFAAPATEINSWVGIPQKKELTDQEETTGFQRVESPTRIKELKGFYKNESNIIQNPILCARRESSVGEVTFEPVDGTAEAEDIEHGYISVNVQPLEEMSLLRLLTLVKQGLEQRVQTLLQAQVSEQLIVKLKTQLKAKRSSTEDQSEATDDESSVELEPEQEEVSSEDVAAVLLDESHVVDFWQQIAARVQVLSELEDEYTEDNFEGFTKEAMISYLRPVVLVDGQHRLRGAISAAQDLASHDPKYQTEIEHRVSGGEDELQVQNGIEARIARRLPVSLLMSTDPAEQVFQFVVVNQKAVPIGKALLGTIVSTTLSNEELERVSTRLKDAGIQLDASRVVAFLTRSNDSPFRGLVEKGTSTNSDLLPWTVMKSLVTIFQKLTGGKLFGPKQNDYAAIWQRKFLDNSGIVAEWEEKGFASASAYWSSPAGPWRDVFIQFWTAIRDKFANTTNAEANNYWGAARKSQIFNKISLTILAADFFQYLCESKTTIDDIEDVARIVKEEWLGDVDESYFASQWKLSGVKKDSPGIKRQWSDLWEQYRKNPVSLPKTKEYRHFAFVDLKSHSRITTSSSIN